MFLFYILVFKLVFRSSGDIKVLGPSVGYQHCWFKFSYRSDGIVISFSILILLKLLTLMPLILFAFGNNMFSYLLMNFLFFKYRRNPAKILNRVLQTQWIIYFIPEKKHLRHYLAFSNQNILI